MDLKKICPLCLRAGKRDRRPKECLYLWGVEDGAEERRFFKFGLIPEWNQPFFVTEYKKK